MKINIITVSHKQPEWVNIAFEEYKKRFSPKEIQLELIEIKPERRNSNKNLELILESEKDKILSHIKPNTILIPLDEHGKTPSTLEFSNQLKNILQSGEHLTFIIGSADGLHSSFKQNTKQTLSLSSFTLPHGLVRVILAEQIYRAYSVIHGLPYHRE